MDVPSNLQNELPYGEVRAKHSADTSVYLDYASTTPADPQVIAEMVQYLGLDGTFGNAASKTHRFGREAEAAVDKARVRVADLINASPSEIVWTSGATESINLAIKGTAHGCAGKGRHLVTSILEHKAVLDSFDHLAKEGFEITYVSPDKDGLISPENVLTALRDDTILVSLMHVNNEVGSITDIDAIGKITRERGITFHVDAAQSGPRLPLDMRSIQADLVSLSGHKMYGPKGIGVLYVNPRISPWLVPQIHGGNQEQGIRSGTLATHQIAGMGMAAQLICEHREADNISIGVLERRLLNHFSNIGNTFVNGSRKQRVPGIVNVGFAFVESEALMLSLKDIAISSGSACTSSRVEPSHVLLGLDVPDERADCSVRFSLGRFTTEEEIDYAATRVCSTVEMLRKLSSPKISSSNVLEKSNSNLLNA